MNRSLILVSRKPIVIQIFTLVCKKLNLSLEVLPEAQIDHKVDIIVVDNEFINDRFNIFKSYCKIIGAISKEELPFGMANDFILSSPFLPSTLQDILDKQLNVLNQRMNSKMYISNVEVEDDTPEVDEFAIGSFDETDPSDSVDYLESLADDIAEDMKDETDESVVSVASVNHGGVLDSSELSMIDNILNNSSGSDDLDNFVPIEESSEDEWVDLSSIIDQAIDEVNTVDNIYDKYDNNPIRLLLNDYELDELKPLLSMLDQDIIDSLTEGVTVNLQLKFENDD